MPKYGWLILNKNGLVACSKSTRRACEFCKDHYAKCMGWDRYWYGRYTFIEKLYRITMFAKKSSSDQDEAKAMWMDQVLYLSDWKTWFSRDNYVYAVLSTEGQKSDQGVVAICETLAMVKKFIARRFNSSVGTSMTFLEQPDHINVEISQNPFSDPSDKEIVILERILSV